MQFQSLCKSNIHSLYQLIRTQTFGRFGRVKTLLA